MPIVVVDTGSTDHTKEIAAGFLAVLLNDAVVNVTIDTGPSFVGLQRPASFSAGADCLAPLSPKPITGTLT